MPIYDLPIWAHDLEEFPTGGIRGRGWLLGARQFSFRNDDERDAHFIAMRERYPRYAITYLDSGNGQSRVAPQLFVEAKDRVAAQRMCNFLRAALCAVDGNSYFDPGELLAVPNDRTELEDLNEYDLTRDYNFVGRSNVLPAARLAAKCSRRKSLQYALLKLNLSFELASAHEVDLHPARAPKHFGVETDRKAHVTMASATTLAYSAIEELQLEPRPVGTNRNIKEGRSWNPEALAELNARLETANINLLEKFVWTVRGSQTRIHKSKRAPEGAKQVWSSGLVRDKAVSVQDALVAASWLRSKCSTHRYGRETESITMFDAHNVQFLARRLILESVGLWRV